MTAVQIMAERDAQVAVSASAGACAVAADYLAPTRFSRDACMADIRSTERLTPKETWLNPSMEKAQALE